MTIEVYTPRWANLLRKLFVGKGTGGQLLQVLDDVLPVVPLVDASEAEQHFIRDESTWSTVGQLAASVGNFTVLAVNNPAGSGRLVVIERVTTSGATVAGGIAGGWATVAAGNGVPLTNDGRTGNLPSGFSAAAVGSHTITASTPAAIGPASSWTHICYATALGLLEELVVKDNAVVIPPGVAWSVFTLTVNTGVDFFLSGYSRPLDPGE